MINIVFIPGIARYNMIILPLSIIIAVNAVTITIKNRFYIVIFTLLIFTLIFNKSPNDFKDEFYNYLSVHNKVFTEQVTEIKVPKNTMHMNDWQYLTAKNEYNKGNYINAIQIIK